MLSYRALDYLPGGGGGQVLPMVGWALLHQFINKIPPPQDMYTGHYALGNLLIEALLSLRWL